MRILTIAICSIILFSCSKKAEKELNYKKEIKDGVEHIINENRPSVPVEELNINLIKVAEINGIDSVDVDKCYFNQAKYFTADSKENVFVFDEHKQMIHKFNKSGEFEISFGGEGTGPGEFRYIMGLTCSNDTIFAFDTNQRKLNKFNSDGKFLGSTVMTSKFSLFNNFFAANGKFWCQRLSIQRVDDKAEMYKLVEVRDNRFNVLSILDSSSIEYPTESVMGELSISKAIAVSEKDIYMADKGDLFSYKINIVDEVGTLKKVVQKKYSRMKVSDSEKDEMVLENQDAGYLKTDDQVDEFRKGYTYKPAVLWIYTDKYRRLWVNESRYLEAPADGKLKFSIFENGVYLNSVLLDIDTTEPNMIYDVLYGNDIQFIGNRIYALDQNENKITIYEY